MIKLLKLSKFYIKKCYFKYLGVDIQSLINSIYKATEGEGVFIGRPQIFVRYQGCNIGCLNCDSIQTWEFENKEIKNKNDNKFVSNREILNKVKKLSTTIKWVSITGGDPLHKNHRESVIDLILTLKDEDFKINIEASGLVIVERIFDLVDFISWDIKLPSTGVRYNDSLVSQMINLYNDKLQIKAVVQDQQDFNKLVEIRKKNNDSFENWVITPAFCLNETDIKKRFEMINRLNEEQGNYFRVIGQQHKWIYGALATDV